MFTNNLKIARSIEVMAHVLTWSYIFLSPLLFKRNGEQIDWNHYFMICNLPLATCIAFYVNYFLLIPRYLLIPGKLRWFFLANLAMFALYHGMMELLSFLSVPLHPQPGRPHGRGGFSPYKMGGFTDFPPKKIMFVIRGFLTFVFAIGVSVTLRLSMRWRQSERARAEAELGRSQAELKNLKNQINPHFLLNTLNNIYALTAFDCEKAQQAIMELSRMLRYMLYENQGDRVSLSKEIEFLKSYISLMRLRLHNKVEVKVDFDVPENEDIPIAPLIFISLIENAFKHGISSTGPSFVHILLKADRHCLHFVCVNSNYPKNETDKAPGGIGLKLVAQRLEMSYPGRYCWTYGKADGGKSYQSEITITDKPIQP